MPSLPKTATTASPNLAISPTCDCERTSAGSNDTSLTHMISRVRPTERGAAYQSPSGDDGADVWPRGCTLSRLSSFCVQRRVTMPMCTYVPSNGLRLSGARKGVRCSRGLAGRVIIFNE